MGKFLGWVEKQGGPGPLARRLKITHHSIRSWLRGEASPNTSMSVKLVALGDGAFDHNDIVADTYRPDIRRRKGIMK